MFERVLSKMSYFYGNSLRSTASDVISICDNRKKVSTTPFYVYFDLTSISSRVFIHINGTDTGVYMVVGEYGQCFFEYPEIEPIEDHITEAFLESSSSEHSTYISPQIVSYSSEFLNRSIIIEESIKKLTEILILKTENDIQKLEDMEAPTENDRLYRLLKKHFRKYPKECYKKPFFSEDEESPQDETLNEGELVKARRENLLKRAFAENFLINHRYKTFYTETSRGNNQYVPNPNNSIIDFIKSQEHSNFLDKSSDKIFFLFCSLLGWNISRFGNDEIRLADVFYSCCSLNETSSIKKSENALDETSKSQNVTSKKEKSPNGSDAQKYALSNDRIYDLKYSGGLNTSAALQNEDRLDAAAFSEHNRSLTSQIHNVKHSVFHNCETYTCANSNDVHLREKEVFFGSSIQVTYSLCGDKKIGKSFKETFMSHITKEFSYDPNFIIQIADNNDEFYMSLDLFLSLFFFILNFNNHPDRNLKICQVHRRNPKSRRKTFTYLKFKNYLKKKLGKDSQRYKKQVLPNTEDMNIIAKHLKGGKNKIFFKMDGVDQSVFAHVFHWSINDKLVISDIDGTITKSDVLGHIYDFVGKDWSHCGVAELFTKIESQNYKFVYLSNRPSSMYKRTSNMLKNIIQNGSKMPNGPIVLNPTGFLNSLVTEVRNLSYFYKITALKQIKDCFICKCDILEEEPHTEAASEQKQFEKTEAIKICKTCGGNKTFDSNNNPFFAGFGNKLSDLIAYKSLRISRSRIFIISSDGQLSDQEKEKISHEMRPFIQKNSKQHSYVTLNNFATTLFPLVRIESDDYSDFYYYNNLFSDNNCGDL